MTTNRPLLPLREVVVFPHTPMSLLVGRPRSLAAVHAAAARPDREIFLAAQRNGDRLNPEPEDIHEYGTIAVVDQVLNLPDGNTKILVEGRRRARIVRHVGSGERAYEVEIEELPPAGEPGPELQALVRTVRATVERYVKLNRAVPAEMLIQVNAIEDPGRLADMLVAPLQFKLADRQELLQTADAAARLERIYKALLAEIEFLQVEKKLKTRVKRDRESNQREQWLGEQMKAIQKEFGDKEGRTDLEELAAAIAAKDLPDHAQERAEKELRKLSQMNLMSAEATVVRNYLDWIIAVPWREIGEKAVDLKVASDVLDADHHGLRPIKERILEYLAVTALVEKMRGPILCLVGPPGVGKTSLARSIARATDRPFAKIALGGVRDEAEIRGHRRTYIGAMPGKLLHAMKRAGRTDPVILLDEVDKMSADFRGDPAAALLEVLDPEQNTAFNDHYLELDYDLSRATFICTANSLQGIPLPLQDRLEIIELSGYTEQEKLGIARRYLLPRQLELHGIGERNLTFSNEALLLAIQRYTKESGVRDLERQIARVCRKVARRVVAAADAEETPHVKVVTANLPQLLGTPRFVVGQRETDDQVGLVKGLAVGWAGGLLLNIEAIAVPGTGKLQLTGRLGDTLKESASAGLTYLRSRADALGLEPDFHQTHDLHVHYPGESGNADGPSAGIAMATATVSALTGIPVRADTAMTGEITLRGRVLPIGGLKEKVLAAHRGGITRVLLPEGNAKDLADLPSRIRESMELIPVSHMDRVLVEALVGGHKSKIFAADEKPATFDVDSDRPERPPRSDAGPLD